MKETVNAYGRAAQRAVVNVHACAQENYERNIFLLYDVIEEAVNVIDEAVDVVCTSAPRKLTN
jgi:SpoU rRNA methylase family enzyme